MKLYLSLLFAILFLSPTIVRAQVSVTLSPVPRQQFFMANGTPLAGGKVCTYAAGTTTPLSTYTDASGTVLNSNPIILDGGGFASIWLTAAEYKFVVLTAGTDSTCNTGTMQWEVDNINSFISPLTLPCGAVPTALTGYAITFCNSANNQLQELLNGNATPLTFAYLNNANTWTAPQIFSGGGSATLGTINNEVWIDGPDYPQTAAGVNTADALWNGTSVNIIVPSTATNLSDTQITVGKLHTLVFLGKGTFSVAGIRLTDSTTDNTGQSNLWCPEGATLQLANNMNTDVVSDTNFGSLTGTANFYGLVKSYIIGCTIDGNKAGNATSGYAVRLFGRNITMRDVTLQNARNDGLYTEWCSYTTANCESDTTPLNDVADYFNNLRIIYNTNNGWTHRGPNDSTASMVDIYQNGLWCFVDQSPIHLSHLNTFLCDNTSPGTTGAIHTLGGGSMAGIDIVGSTATGWGWLEENTTGSNEISASIFGSSAGIGVELRSTSQSVIEAAIANASMGVPGLKINGGGACLCLLQFFPSASSTFNIDFASEALQSTIIANTSGATSGWFEGAPSPADLLMLNAIPGVSDSGVVSLGYAPVFNFQVSGGILNSAPSSGPPTTIPPPTGFQHSAISGCSTAASLAATCTVTVAWSTAFADTNYHPVCSGIGIGSGVPIYGGITSVATTGVVVQTVSATSAAAAYSSVDCIATH